MTAYPTFSQSILLEISDFLLLEDLSAALSLLLEMVVKERLFSSLRRSWEKSASMLGIENM
jgi:hypothetical protein